MRNHKTYRFARRNRWHMWLTFVGWVPEVKASWAEQNTVPKPDPWHIGSVQGARVTMRAAVARSKYTPHQGKREMARRRQQLAA